MRAFKLHFAMVARRQGTRFVDDVHQHLRAVGWQPLTSDGVGLQYFLRSICRRHKGLAVFHFDAARAAYGNGLDVFGTHHGANARTSGCTVEIVDDGGVIDLVLAGKTDAGHVQHWILMLFFDPLFGVPDAVAPDGGRVLDLAFVVNDRDVNGLGRFALKDDHIPAGELQLSAEVAARVRAGNGVGQRTLGDDRVAAAG